MVVPEICLVSMAATTGALSGPTYEEREVSEDESEEAEEILGISVSDMEDQRIVVRK